MLPVRFRPSLTPLVPRHVRHALLSKSIDRNLSRRSLLVADLRLLILQNHRRQSDEKKTVTQKRGS